MKTKTEAKHTSFTVTYSETGKDYRWTFWRDARKPAGWVLRDHEGYERNGPATWIDFIPFVHLIASNYGMTCSLS